MKIVTVCKMNQARSPIAESVLRSNFPEFEFYSTGITAISGTPILKSVQVIAKDWGLNYLKQSSHSMRDIINEILNAELIIVAEDAHLQTIRELGYKGELYSCESVLPDYMFTPKDPEGMPLDKTRRELGKVAGLSLRILLRKLDLHSPNKITAVIPNGSSDVPLAIQTAHLEATNRNAFLLDSDMRAPLPESELREFGLNPIYFDIDTVFDLGIPDLQTGEILVHSRELGNPERLYLSKKWRDFLDLCSENKELVLLTAPRYAKTRSLPDSFIVASLADEFLVIST